VNCNTTHYRATSRCQVMMNVAIVLQSLVCDKHLKIHFLVILLGSRI